jgi:hypothetical protein
MRKILIVGEREKRSTVRFDLIFNRCEYILYRGLYRTSYARISRGSVTDTELQIGQFLLPRHGFVVQNDTKTARYLRSYKEELAVDHVRVDYPYILSLNESSTVVPHALLRERTRRRR